MAAVLRDASPQNLPSTDKAKHGGGTLSVQTSNVPLPSAPSPSPSKLSQPSQLSPTQSRLELSAIPPLSPTNSSIQSPTRARSMNYIIAEHSKSLTSIPYDSDRESSRFRSLTSFKKVQMTKIEQTSGPPGPSKQKSESSPAGEEPRESTSSSKTEKQKSPPIRYVNQPF